MKPSSTRFAAVVSDLHLGEGGRLESFAHGESFCELLRWVASRGRAGGGVSELVLNGDCIDFLQIAPCEPLPWRAALSKLDACGEANAALFGALRAFVRDGHRVVVLVGNHDIELAFGEVQARLTRLVAGDHDSLRANVSFPNESPLGKQFVGWTQGPFVYRLGPVHVEHGNQFDPLNAFDHGDFYADESAGRVRLPWGSRFVLAVFNHVKQHYPMLDRMRSKSAAALLVWTLDPQLAWKHVPGVARLGGTWVAALKRAFLASPAAPGGGARAAVGEGTSEAAFLAELGEFAQDLDTVLRGVPSPRAPDGRNILSQPVIEARTRLLRGGLRRLHSDEDELSDDDAYAADAIAVGATSDATTVIFGHSHGARDRSENGVRYLNTGTWTDLVKPSAGLREALEGSDAWTLVAALLKPDAFVSAPQLSVVTIDEPEGACAVRLVNWNEGAPS